MTFLTFKGTFIVLSFQWLAAQSGCRSKSPKDITEENSAEYYKEKAMYVSPDYIFVNFIVVFDFVRLQDRES